MNTYIEGEIVTFQANFANSSATPLDPTVVIFWYEVVLSAGSPPIQTFTLTYGSQAIPTVGQVARTGAGIYVALIDTTGLPGQWTVEWKSTGVGQTTGTTEGYVKAAPF